jgi:hypothetical protein
MISPVDAADMAHFSSLEIMIMIPVLFVGISHFISDNLDHENPPLIVERLLAQGWEL